MEDMLRAYVLKYGSDWEKSLTHAKFSYNNSYQACLKMSPFKALYGRKCRTPLMWLEVRERSFFGPAKIKDAEEGVILRFSNTWMTPSSASKCERKESSKCERT